MTDQIQSEIFEDDPGLGEAPAQADVPVTGVARGLRPNWGQLELRACDLEALLPGGQRARLAWA